jgi:hypothetical protein
MSEKFWQWEIQNSQPVTVGARTITPQTQVVSLRLPFGGFVWNRPAAVLVEENGRVQRLPIPDVTRMILIAVAVVSMVVALLAEVNEGKE